MGVGNRKIIKPLLNTYHSLVKNTDLGDVFTSVSYLLYPVFLLNSKLEIPNPKLP
ncbi:hypothetical protein NIES3974_45280 [Calothrix sp. NIES-3974]|nr:hypothetical protein NIES3974_45280 [Calothrix sp. NIES-3974]